MIESIETILNGINTAKELFAEIEEKNDVLLKQFNFLIKIHENIVTEDAEYQLKINNSLGKIKQAKQLFEFSSQLHCYIDTISSLK